MSALLPCPFCGSTEVSVSHTVHGACWVVCETAACGAIGPTQLTPAGAVSAWNTRVLGVEGDADVARPEDAPVLGPPEAVLPVERESRLVGDIAGFRVRDVELGGERAPSRRPLARPVELIAVAVVLAQVSGTRRGGLEWHYATSL